MNLARRLRAPVLLIGAIAALLVFAATAAAETRTGESASPLINNEPSAEATIVKGSASYETTAGSASLDITTGAEPQTESAVVMIAGLFTMPPSEQCSVAGFAASPEPSLTSLAPLILFENPYAEPTIEAVLLTSPAGAPVPMPVTKTVSGPTTTLSFTSSAAANLGFNCALVETEEGEGEAVGTSLLMFPISAPPPAPTPPPAPAPTPAPAALSIGKLKPLKLKAKKWKTVKVKVTNSGGTATVQGSLRVKAPAGVLVKPERQKLPVLAPGASWTLSVRVQLTAKAKKKSTLRLTGAASGVSGESSLVIKLKP